MATTTFDKNITINRKAAKRIVKILEQPAPPRPKLAENFWEENEKEVNEWLSRSEE